MNKKRRISTFNYDENSERIFQLHPKTPKAEVLRKTHERYIGVIDDQKKVLRKFKSSEKRHLQSCMMGYINDYKSIKGLHRYVRSSESKKIDVDMLADKLKALSPIELVCLVENLGF